MNDSIHRQMALDYLKAELGDAAPASIEPVASFDEAPLDGEGSTSMFRFTAALDKPEEPYCVFAGQTVANYYPDWGLEPEDMYSVHLGTRFMLVVGVQQAPLESLPENLEENLIHALSGVAPGEMVSDYSPVAAFQAEGQIHAVCRMTIADEAVYVLGADLPLGIYRDTHLPPHVIYRRHLGNVIRMEENAE